MLNVNIFSLKQKQNEFADFLKNERGFSKFYVNRICWIKFLKFLPSINLPWGHVMSHTKFAPDRFSRFDVYWIQTNKQADRQAKFLYRLGF